MCTLTPGSGGIVVSIGSSSEKRIGGGRALSSAESEDSAGSESSDISVGDEGVGHVWSDWDVSAESKVRPEGEPSVTFFAVERLEVRGLLSSPPPHPSSENWTITHSIGVTNFMGFRWSRLSHA